MKFRCLDNTDVEELLTVGKVYAGVDVVGIMVRVFRCDDKHEGNFRSERFELVPEEIDTVSKEPEVSIYVYTLDTQKR